MAPNPSGVAGLGPSAYNFAVKRNPLQVFFSFCVYSLGRLSKTLSRKRALGTIYFWRPHECGLRIFLFLKNRSIVYFFWGGAGQKIAHIPTYECDRLKKANMIKGTVKIHITYSE